MIVELVYEKRCPNIAAARVQLLRAFGEAGLTTPRWQEWEIRDPEAPAHIHGYGSPTILVNGEDVSGAPPVGENLCCRVYAQGEAGSRGVPALADISKALASRSLPMATGSLKLNGTLIPTVGVVLLPKLVCPACWPAYAGLLGALGLGFIDYTPYLLPLTGIFVAIVLATLAFRARRRHGFNPLGLGIFASLLLLAGKFYYGSDSVMYIGLGLIIAASIWNTWPRRRGGEQNCPACNQDRPVTKDTVVATSQPGGEK